jgi:DNA polymerase/3'-5' exonuclease PolX
VSSGRKVALGAAVKVARAIVAELAPACERIEIAGSIRRRRPQVSDIEVVAQPMMMEGPRVDLFSAPAKVSALDALLLGLEAAGRLVPHPDKPAAGPRYKRLFVAKAEMQLDLFVVLPPAEWGPIFSIRTGPAAYSAAAVTALREKFMRCEDGAIWQGNTRIPCPDEETFFRLCGLPLVAPEQRGVQS